MSTSPYQPPLADSQQQTSVRRDGKENPDSPRFPISIWGLLFIAANLALLTSLARLSDLSFSGFGKLLKAYGVLLTVYGWRYVIARSSLPKIQRIVAIVFVLLACLVFIYLFIDPMFPNSRNEPAAKWLGLPIWLFTIPVISFLIFDLRDPPNRATTYTWRSAFEILVLFLVWMYVWVFLQWCLGWGHDPNFDVFDHFVDALNGDA